MKTTTLFLICLLTFIAVLSVTFFYVPTLATQANSFLLSIPKRFESVATWATTNLGTIIATGITTAAPVMYGANWLHKRYKSGQEESQKLLDQQRDNIILGLKKQVAENEVSTHAKDTLITQLQAGQTTGAEVQAKLEAAETQNLTVATERNQAKQLLEEWRLKYIPQEQKIE